MSLCLSAWPVCVRALTFESLDIETRTSLDILINFICQGHLVYVKVTDERNTCLCVVPAQTF